MKKKSLFSMLLVALFGLATTSTIVSCKDYDDDIANVNQRLDKLSSETAQALKDTKAELEGKLEQMKADYIARDAQLQTAINEAKQAAANAQAAADKAQGAADKAQGTADQAVAAAAANAEKIQGLAADVAALATRIEAAEKAIADINTILDTKASKAELEAAVLQIRGEIEAVEKGLAAKIDNVITTLNGVDDRLTKIEGRMTAAEAKAIEQGKLIEKNIADIAALNEGLELQKKALDAYKEEIKGALQTINEKSDAQDAAIKAVSDKLTQEVARIDAELTKINDKIAAVQVELAQAIVDAKKELKAEIDLNADAISGHELRIATNEALVKQHTQNIATINSVLLQHAEELQLAKDSLRAETAAAVATLSQTFNDSIDSLYSRLQDATDEIYGWVSAAEVRANQALNAAMEEVDAELTDIKNDIAALNDRILVLESDYHMLRSLVTVPEAYYYGVQAIVAASYSGDVYEIDASKITKTGETVTPVSSNNPFYISKDVYANYHMNPSSFDIKKIVKLDFVSDDKDYRTDPTRAAAWNPQAVSFERDSTTGYLKVLTTLDVEKIKKVSVNGQISVLALQATIGNTTGKDTTITSDYAAVTANEYKQLEIVDTTIVQQEPPTNPWYHWAWNQCGLAQNAVKRGFHTFTNMQAALADNWAGRMHTIEFNKTVDIDSLVQAHWVMNDALRPDGFKSEVAVTAADIKDFHLKWNFAIAPYLKEDGKAVKDSAKYVTLDSDNVLHPTSAAIGDTIVIRSTVTSKDGKNVAVGYIKFLVTGKAASASANVDGYNVVGKCEKGDTIKGITYEDLRAQVKAQLGDEADPLPADVAEFFKIYPQNRAEGLLPATDATTGAAAGTKYGEVIWNATKKQWDWALTGADVQELVYKNGEYVDTMKATKTFVLKSINSTVYPDITITLTSNNLPTPKAQQIPTGKLDEGKIKIRWYEANSTVAGSGWEAMHFNVHTVLQDGVTELSGDESDWGTQILNGFYNSKVVIPVKWSDGSTDNTSFNNCKVRFYFAKSNIGREITGQSGVTYKLDWKKREAGKDSTIIVAIDEKGRENKIVTINPNKGIVKLNPTTVTKDIVNGAHSVKALEKSLRLTIAMLANTTTGCADPLPVSETFDIVYVRPLNATGKTAVAVDAQTSGNEIKVRDLLDFKDWRNLWAGSEGETATEEEYVIFYGIESVEVNVAEVKFNEEVNPGDNYASWPLLSTIPGYSIAPNVTDSTLLEAGDLDGLGVVTIGNSLQTQASHTLALPLHVKYAWGEYTTWATVEVAGTINQHAPRK